MALGFVLLSFDEKFGPGSDEKVSNVQNSAKMPNFFQLNFALILDVELRVSP